MKILGGFWEDGGLDNIWGIAKSCISKAKCGHPRDPAPGYLGKTSDSGQIRGAGWWRREKSVPDFGVRDIIRVTDDVSRGLQTR